MTREMFALVLLVLVAVAVALAVVSDAGQQ